jgi:hypothetical protein
MIRAIAPLPSPQCVGFTSALAHFALALLHFIILQRNFSALFRRV